MPPRRHSHPVFARAYALLSRSEERFLADFRRELVADLSGRVVEIGAGNGLNFSHYPAEVAEVVAVEPEPYLRRQAERAAGQAPVPITVVAGVAEELPFAVGSFDAAVVSLVLCSVADPRRALAEIRRVIKVGGELRFYEHVQAQEPRLRRLQRLLDYVWPYLAGGCHTSRDTVALIESAGFAMERCRRFSFRPCLLAVPTSPQVIGRACNGVGASA